jgi:flagellar hook-basal body complex protein FliE
MAIQNIGIKAYTQALNNFQKAERNAKSGGFSINEPQRTENSFATTLQESLGKVNDLQAERRNMITAFASGESQNVHELMISLQKAGLAMSMTSAVRNKVMEAYKELSHLQF